VKRVEAFHFQERVTVATDLIPFGKYKGQPVEQLQNDPEYTRWLIQQPWFTSRYNHIQTLIVNNFKEASDSPDHNAMQARFLDPAFSFSVGVHVAGLMPFAQWEATELATFRQGRTIFEQSSLYAVEFEVHGWDVVIDAEFWCYGSNKRSTNSIDWRFSLYCELKPTMGEDFPAALRQVKTRRNRPCCVLVDEFLAKSVSFDDARRIFELSQVHLIRTSDVIIQEVPDWVLNPTSKKSRRL
jgi:uncharacterized protein (DUF3820 family)